MAGSTWTWIGATSDPTQASNWTLASGSGNATDRPQAGDTDVIGGSSPIQAPLFLNTFLSATTLDLVGTGSATFSNTTTISTSSGIDAASIIDVGEVTAGLAILGTFLTAGTIEATSGGLAVSVSAGTVGSLLVPGNLINDGSILVSAGARMTFGIGATSELTDNGLISVTGGSLIENGGSFAIGSGGNGSLAISGGGVVNAGTGTVDISAVELSDGTVTVIGGTLTAGGIVVGGNAYGSLAVSGGGVVNVGAGTVNIGAGEVGYGMATVAGGTLTAGDIVVGNLLYPRSDTLVVGSGGLVFGSTVIVDDLVSMAGGTLDASTQIDFAAAGGLISGYGIIAGPTVLAGRLIASGGTLEVTGALSAPSGTITIDGGAAFRADSVANIGSVVFAASSSPGTLILRETASVISTAITGLAVGDRIELNIGSLPITDVAVTTTGTVTIDANQSVSLLNNVSFAAGASQQFIWGTDPITGDDYIQVAPSALVWFARSSTNFGQAINWTSEVLPTAATPVTFNVVPGTITGAGSALDMTVGGLGTWVFAGTTLSVADFLNVGDGGTGLMTIDLAGVINVGTGSVNIGTQSGGHGTLVVQRGTLIAGNVAVGGTLAGTSGTLAIGTLGLVSVNTMFVDGPMSVEDGTLNASSIAVGDTLAGTNGTLEIAAQGSVSTSTLDIDGPVSLENGTLVAGDVVVGSTLAGTNGTLTIGLLGLVTANTVDVASLVSMTGGTLEDTTTPAFSGSTASIAGYGIIVAPLVSDGTFTATGGTLVVDGALEPTSTAAITIDGGAAVRVDQYAGGGSYTFASPGSPGKLILNDVGLITVAGATITGSSVAITGLNLGDQIELGLAGKITDAVVSSPGTVTIDTTADGLPSSVCMLTNVSFAAGAPQQLIWGTDPTTGEDYIQVSATTEPSTSSGLPRTLIWLGGTGDWYSTSQWSAVSGPEPYPFAGDSVFINSGTVDLAGSEETSHGTVDGEQITLGSANRLSAAAIVATEATLGNETTITSSGTAAYALLAAIGPTGDSGTIIADAAGGSFTLQAVQADGTQAADLVLLPGGAISVSNGDNLILDGVITSESGVTIAAGSTLTNDGTYTLFGGGTDVDTGATLQGTGTFVAAADATLVLDSAVPDTQTLTFGSAGRVDLGDLSAFDGQITGFLLGNTIDLLNTLANYASFDAATDQLIVENGTSLIATLDLQGPAGGLLATATDGNGGTVITYPDSPARISLEATTGAVALGANVVQQTMTTASGAPILGTGIKIGIISDSFNATVNGVVDPANTAAAEGYLPANPNGTSAVTILQDSTLTGVENEGLAMAELIHQVAPGAQIYFYSGEGGQDSFAAGVTALVNAGVNVIVDDLSYFDSPFFQVAGPIDTAIENAMSHGVNYFSAAGNFGNAFFQSTWQPTSTSLEVSFGNSAQTVSAQEFDNGTPLQTVTIPANTQSTFELEWSAAWPSSGGSVPDQLGMALYNSAGQLVATSQQETGSPDYTGLPEISLVAPTSSVSEQYQLAIYQIGTVPVSQFKYIVLGSPVSADGAVASTDGAFITDAEAPGAIIDDPAAGQGSGTVFGHQLVPGVNTVGATYWSNTPAYGVAPDWTEFFSSGGPGTLLFNQNGTALTTPQSAGKVDFTAPDGVETSLSAFQPFSGTSAAAPDAAAVAALMLQANPKLTTAQVTAMLEASAVSMELPAGEQGAGLIQAPAAVALAEAASGASGQVFVWTGASGASVASAANWDNVTTATDPASLPPGALDTAQFLSGGGIVIGTDTVSLLQFSNDGDWTLGSGATLTAATAISVASGSVTISAGGHIAGDGVGDMISGTGGATASVLVTGAGAAWTSAGSLVVGNAGIGTLSIQASGKVASGAGTIANTDTASGSSVSVSGSASDWQVNGTLDVGNAGAGTLDVASGTVAAAGDIYIGLNGTGVATIGSGGTILAGGTFDAIGYGAGSVGSLVVNAGGTFEVTSTAQVPNAVEIGVEGPSGPLAASQGSVLVNGAGALLSTNGIPLGVGAGTGSDGSLTIAEGGSVVVASPGSQEVALFIGSPMLSTGVVTVTGSGSELTSNGYALIGRGGSGTLLIENGASVVVNNAGSTEGGIGIGAGAASGTQAVTGGNGTVMVSGGGVLDDTSSLYGISVGSIGPSGDLNVNGGTVIAGPHLAVGAAGVLAGTVYGGAGTVSIGTGGTVEITNPIGTSAAVQIGTAGTDVVGPANAATGMVTVSGAGALLTSDNNGIAVGSLEDGSLSVLQGGSVTTGSLNDIAFYALGIGRQGNGSVAIADAGSTIIANGVVSVGRAGAGNLTIEADGGLFVGEDSTEVGGVLIGGAGLSNSNTLFVGGTGTVLVSTGGNLFSQLGVTVGENGSDGGLTVESGGTVEAGTSLSIGRTTTLATGGVEIASAGTTTIALATSVGGSGVVTVGAGGVLMANGTGLSGTPDLSIGAGTGSSGVLEVTGAGALATSDNGTIAVGGAGSGMLDVTDEGVVNAGSGEIDFGASGGSSGSGIVAGNNSVLTSTGRVVVGNAGLGALAISGGGTVSTGGAIIANTTSASGSSVNVTGIGASWTIGGTLDVGNAGAGALNIAAGATVSAAALDSGIQLNQGANPFRGTGAISLSGPGSELAVSGTVVIADSGTASLSITDGATLLAANMSIGRLGHSSGEVLVSDPGSTLDVSGTLSVGTTLGTGQLTIGPGGTVIAHTVIIEGEIVNESGDLDPNTIVVSSTSEISGTGVSGGVGDVIVNDFIINAQAGKSASTMTVLGTITGTGTLQIESGSTLYVTGGPVGAGQSVVFKAGSGALILGDVSEFGGTIAAFMAGDTILLQGTSIASEVFVGNTLTLLGSGGGTLGVVDFASGALSGGYLAASGGAVVGIACFAEGTRLATSRGSVAVEALGVGSLVRTESGAVRPITWIGHRTVECARHPKPAAVWPVRIAAGAFGGQVPHRDLYLSPDHAVYVNEVLIPVRYLVNGTTIVQVQVDRITYYHVELPSHDVVLADGLPTESYLETGDRANFANGGGVVRQFPDFAAHAWEAMGCAPLVVSGPELAAARQYIGCRMDVALTNSQTMRAA